MSTIFQTAGVKVLKPETHAGIKMLMPWGATQEKGGKKRSASRGRESKIKKKNKHCNFSIKT